MSAILHVTTFLQGGAGRAVCDLAIGQHDAGQDVAVVTSATAVAGYANYPEYLSRLRQAGVTLHEIDSTFQRDPAAHVAVVEALRDRLARGRLDLIHAHAGKPAVIALAIAARARPRIPVVQTMHGWGSNKTPEQAARDLAVLQEVDAVVTTSHASARWLQEQGIEARLLTTIPCGLDAAPPAGDPVARFPEVAAAKAAGAAVVVCIGTVSAHKNQARLVEAWPLVRDRIDRALVCVFAGEGPLIPDLERRARQLGVADECRFLGYQPSAALLLALADLLVLPSRGEGQGLAVLEAFRAGVPAVVSDVPALVELVLDGTTGYVARGDTAAALADGIVRALGATAEKRHAITAEAHAQFASHFTTRAMLEAHDALYRQVCRAGL